MRNDRERGKRNNWLLIKHKDNFDSKDGEAVLEQDRSIASGRSMEEIAAGKGRGPRPFMAPGNKAVGKNPAAIWHSNKGANTSRI